MNYGSPASLFFCGAMIWGGGVVKRVPMTFDPISLLIAGERNPILFLCQKKWKKNPEKMSDVDIYLYPEWGKKYYYTILKKKNGK